jgi:hypothetical protein
VRDPVRAPVDLVHSSLTRLASAKVRDLVRAQRYWPLSLERDDPAAAADGLIQARPLLAEFRRVLANDFNADSALSS